MTNDQIIHEAMGKCWHEWEPRNHIFTDCKKCGIGIGCGIMYKYENPDYSKWEHYGPMLEWAMEQEWWGDFWESVYEKALEEYEAKTNKRKMPSSYFWGRYLVGIWGESMLLTPTRGRDAIAEFLKEKV